MFCSFIIPNSTHCSNLKIIKRKFTDDSINKFKADLTKYRWDLNINDLDVNKDFDKYMENLIMHYNNNFPIKEYTIKEKHIGKPYITSAIKKMHKTGK